MDVCRGEIWWADLNDPRGSEPGYRRPVLVVQANSFNRSRISTVVVILLTSNVRLANAHGNVLVTRKSSGLVLDSVVNVSQILTLDRNDLDEPIGRLPSRLMASVDAGLKAVLGLS